MRQTPNEHDHRTDHRRLPLWTVLLLVLAVALVVNVAVQTSRIGFLIPVFVALAIAVHSERHGRECGRRHAK